MKRGVKALMWIVPNKNLKTLGPVIVIMVVISSPNVALVGFNKSFEETKPPQGNFGPMTPPDTLQDGEQLTYTGSGTIQALSTTLDTLPAVTIPDNPKMVSFLLNTGILTGNCGGFMQVGMFEDTTNTWRPIYMNGEPHCWLSNISPNGAFAQGNQLIFRIGHSGSTTTYSVYNAATQKNSTQSVTSLSTWNQNTFQTMTESLSEQASIGSTYYDNSYIVDPNGQRIYITNGSPGGIPTEYGGACTIAPWYEGAWQDSFHGHFQPAVNPVGHCGFLMVDVHTIGFGNYANPAYIQYGPDSFSAQLYGGNQGDGAYITTELSGTAGPLFTGTLYIDGYSYNNGRGAYSSHVKVDVSSDGNTFTNIYSQTWNPSSNNSPSWISIGSVTNIRYVKVTAIDDGGLSANIFMDALRVT